ncbi:MAG: archease [Elusimicrobiota bacterium]
MSHKKFRELEHTADAGIEGTGKSINRVFENTALGMLELSGARPAYCREEKEIKITSPDIESLLVDFLNEIIFMINFQSWAPREIKCDISEKKLKAKLKGASLSSKEMPAAEIKAATYHNLKISKKGRNYKAEVFFDL